MQRYPQDRNHHEREERLDALGQMQIASPDQQTIWGLQDDLWKIDHAERVLARGYIAASDYPIVSVLNHRSPEQARAETHARLNAALARFHAVDRITA